MRPARNTRHLSMEGLERRLLLTGGSESSVSESSSFDDALHWTPHALVEIPGVQCAAHHRTTSSLTFFPGVGALRFRESQVEVATTFIPANRIKMTVVADETPVGEELAVYDAEAATLMVHINNAAATTGDNVVAAIDGLREFTASVHRAGVVDGSTFDAREVGWIGADRFDILGTLPGAKSGDLAVEFVKDSRPTGHPTATYIPGSNTLQIHVSTNGESLYDVQAAIVATTPFGVTSFQDGDGWIESGSTEVRTRLEHFKQVATGQIEPWRSGWQNPIDPYDVDGDGRRGISDLVAIVAYQHEHGQGSIESPYDQNGFIDVDGDCQAQAVDAVMMASQLYSDMSLPVDELTVGTSATGVTPIGGRVDVDRVDVVSARLKFRARTSFALGDGVVEVFADRPDPAFEGVWFSITADGTAVGSEVATYDADAGKLSVSINNAAATTTRNIAAAFNGIDGFTTQVERVGAVDGSSHDLSVSAVTESVELEITPTPNAPIQEELVVSVINDAERRSAPSATYHPDSSTLQIHVSREGLTSLADIAAAISRLPSFEASILSSGDGFIDGGSADANPARSILYKSYRSAWQNPVDPYDVDQDGQRGASDLLAVLDFLHENGTGNLESDYDGGPLVDVDGDGQALIIDAILLTTNLFADSNLD